MDKIFSKIKKIYLNLQLVWFKAKLSFKLRKLSNLVMGIVIVAGIVLIMGGKFVGVGEAAISNIGNISNINFAKCENAAQNSPIKKWIKSVSNTFNEVDTPVFQGTFAGLNTIGNVLTRPCKFVVIVPQEELEDFYLKFKSIENTYLPNYNNIQFSSNNSLTMTYLSGPGISDFATDAVTAMYKNNSVSTSYSLNDTIASINPLNQVSAAVPSYSTPTGVEILSVIQQLWKSIRDIVLMLYIIIFFIIAFSIMFRRKLSGQTYVNVINSIPSIIISLILIIFSYNIASVIIDLGNLSTNILQNYAFTQVPVIIQKGGTIVPVSITNGANVGEVRFSGTDNFGNSTSGNTLEWFYDNYSDTHTFYDNVSANNLNIFNVFGFSNALNNLTASSSTGTGTNISLSPIFVGGSVNTIIETINNILKPYDKDNKLNLTITQGNALSGLVAFILGVVAFFTLFKAFFALLKQYIVMLFYPVLAPIFFLMSAIPGQSKYISKWLKSMVAATLSFTAFYGIAILIVFLGNGFLGDVSKSSWFPAGVGLQGTTSMNAVFSLAAFGLFMMIPSIPKTIESAVGAASDFEKYTSPIVNQTRSIARKIPGVNLIPFI